MSRPGEEEEEEEEGKEEEEVAVLHAEVCVGGNRSVPSSAHPGQAAGGYPGVLKATLPPSTAPGFGACQLIHLRHTGSRCQTLVRPLPDPCQTLLQR